MDLPTGAGGRTRGQWLLAALAAAATTVAALTVAFAGYLRDFALRGDDFSLVLHSSPQYIRPAQMLQWFTNGYVGYWDNYPAWPADGTAFVRPLLNFMIWGQGLLAPRLGDRAYLLADYCAVIVTVWLVVMLLRRYTNAGPWGAATLAVAVGLSPVWYLSLFSPTMGTVAIPFCVAAFVVLDPARETPGWRRLLSSSVLVTMGVGIHETSLVAAGICVALLFAFAPGRPRVRDALWFAIPFAWFGLERLTLGAPAHVYAFGFGPAAIAGRLRHLLAGPFLPYDQVRFLLARMEGLSVGMGVAWAVALAANAIVFAAIVAGLYGRDRMRLKMGLMAALAMSWVFPIVMDSDPRFMGLSMIVSLLAAIALDRVRPVVRWLVIGSVACASAALFVVILAADMPVETQASRFASSFAQYLRESISRSGRTDVVLVNDPVGLTSARAMVQMAAWPRTDVRVIVVNSYDGSLAGARASSLTVENGRLLVSTRFGEGQTLRFWGNQPDFAVPNEGFTYAHAEVDADREYERSLDASGPVVAGRTIVLGVDPRTGRPLVPLLP